MRLIDVKCDQCAQVSEDVLHTHGEPFPACRCGGATYRLYAGKRSATVIGDDIPGGVLVHNAICNDDGSPRRYYSHSEMRRAAAAKGWVNHVERGVADKKDYDRLTRRA